MAKYTSKYYGNAIDNALGAVGVPAAFDPDRTLVTAYHVNDYVSHQNKVWRCKDDNVHGAWNAVNWEEVTSFSELRRLMGTSNGYEQVTVNFSVNAGSGVVAGKSVVVRFTADSQGTTQTLTISNDGKITFSAAYGDRYRIEPSAMSLYAVNTTPYFTALMPARIINLRYVYLGANYYVIDEDKVITPYAEWDTANNSRAVFLMYNDSTLPTPIIWPKTVNVTSATFQAEYVDCPLVTNRGNATAANADLEGKTEADKWVTWAETPDATTGETPVQKYNRLQGKSLTLDQYLPAIRGCYNKTVSIGGSSVHGYLPSMGQLRTICDNLQGFKEVHSVVSGATFPSLDGGSWWSCSECYLYDCWFLNGGATASVSKGSSYQLFALYDLSEINL